MKVLDEATKFAHLGKPGTAFSKGFERRLKKVERLVNLKDAVILDQGAGEGVWMNEFTNYTSPSKIFGFDIDKENFEKFQELQTGVDINKKIPLQNFKICPAEKLDFDSNFFDVVFSNEVLEHVQDDNKSVKEVIRVLKPGGYFVIFTPNRGWPFETHGMFFRGKYYWGNIPFLPWLPKFVSKRFASHVRNYSNKDIKRLFSNIDAKIIYHSHVFPGFDKLSKKRGLVGKLVQKFFHAIEKTPLNYFGISHFLIVKKSK